MIRSKSLEAYIEKSTSDEPELLKKIDNITHTRLVNPRMVSGHVQGRFLSMISNMIKPFRVLEIGTFTGYSAACLAEGIQTGGALHTIEINDELEDLILQNFSDTEYKDIFHLHIGDASEIVKQFSEGFDLIFIDGEKRDYPKYFETCLPLLNKGGYMLADNVLWDGKVVDATQMNDEATLAIMQYNALVKAHPQLECVMLEIRDGISIARKIN